jgi:hypothetical protein
VPDVRRDAAQERSDNVTEAKDDADTVLLALSFFRSVIRSGELWTEECDRAIRAAVEAVERMRRKLTQ